jgi:deltex-like protein
VRRPEKPLIRGTQQLVYGSTFQDDEKATFHTICAMEAYGDKSPEELRMEDYVMGNRPSGENSISVSPLVEGEPMDFELHMDQEEVALAMADKFLVAMAAELWKDEWTELTSFVQLNRDTIMLQLGQLFLLRLQWKEEGRPVQFSVGYHYTMPSALPEIRKFGLRTKEDRQAMRVTENFFAAALGDGVYSGNDPTTFYNFRPGATAGLMMIRLISRVGCDRDLPKDGPGSVDTLWHPYASRCGEVVVLRQSAQCAALIEFQGEKTTPERKIQLLRLQNYFEGLIDHLLSEEREKEVAALAQPLKETQPLPIRVISFYLGQKLKYQPTCFEVQYVAPQTLSVLQDRESILEAVPSSVADSDDECVICMDKLRNDGPDLLLKLKGCGHVFHKECAHMILDRYSVCPTCRFLFKQPRGLSPSGCMQVTFDPTLTCAGSDAGAIIIEYQIMWGVQKSYHPNPSKCHQGSTRTAYAPDSEFGRRLLQRLVYAFLRGLTFSVGASLTSGRDDVITWASIHHKTSMSSGPHGFPDPSFFANCNGELDAAGVPKWGERALKLPEANAIDRFIEGSQHK